MKRRQLMQYAGAGFLATMGLNVLKQQSVHAQTGAVTIQYLGHTCFLFTGDGYRLLVNPFRSIGCTAGYPAPQVAADIVMISSRLLDEGAVEGLPGDPRLLSDPGIYEFPGLQIQGIATDHDDLGGRRFGLNVAWQWAQTGVNILHLGGAAAPITVEQQILMGRPDVLLLPVGNGAKAFTPEEARSAVQTLNPKLIIPTHYRTTAADEASCDILPVDDFLALMEGIPVERVGNTITVSAGDLPETGARIEVLSYAS
ncbi:MAG: MBL fold metallo-hydrolase [Elainellaceae cyanobacterium]